MSNPIKTDRRSGLWRTLKALCLVGLLVTVFKGTPASAQTDQGAIVGVVTDSTGAVIPNADVTLTAVDTGLVLKTKSNGSGNYFFAPIKVGSYTVSASAANFQTTVEQNVVVHVQDRLNIPLELKPGKASETITVTSVAPLMQTQTAETALDIDSQFLNDAPLENRNWVFIAQEAPGSTPYVGRGAGNGDFSSNGEHEEQNNFMLDGVDNNVVDTDYINGSSYNVAPPPDAISEFKLETSDYSAEIGRGHGAVLNATTKSGTNAIHGDLWEYNRNTIFDAQVWNQNPSSPAPAFHLNQFGATLGAPIIKNHLFFFGDVQESRYANGASPAILSVPTARERQGDFSELLTPALVNNTCPQVLFQPNVDTGNYTCSGGHVTVGPSGSPQQYGSSVTTGAGYTFAAGQNVFNPATLDTVAQTILKEYPCPNNVPSGTTVTGSNSGKWQTGNCNTETSPDYGPVYNNYVYDLPSWSDPIQWDGRLDWNISSKDLAYVVYHYQHVINTFDAPLGPVLDGTGSNQGHNQSYLSESFDLSETHTFSPTLINEFRFGYNYGIYANLQYNAGNNISASLGLGGVPFSEGPLNGGLPAVTIGGIQAFGAHGNDPSLEGMDIYQIIDNVTKVVGNHSLKMGFEFMPIRFHDTAVPSPRGAYTFNGMYTQVTGQSNTGNGVADFIAQGHAPGGGLTGTDNMQTGSISTFAYQNFEYGYIAGYLQDDWKLSHKLTMNLGLRYEYYAPQEEMSDHWNNMIPETGYMTSNGAVGSSIYLFPASQQSLTLSPNLVALLAAENVQVEYTPNRRLSSYPKANWSPRFGVSYQIDDKTVARLGAGIFMGGFEPGGGVGLTQGTPYVTSATLPTLPSCANGAYCASQQSVNNTLEGGLGGFQAAGGIQNYQSSPGMETRDTTMHMPYTMNFNMSVQRAFWKGTTATVGYVGSLGRHLVTGTSGANMAMAITTGGQQLNGTTRLPGFTGNGWMQWTAISSYDALQATVQKHYGNGLSFVGTYTWAHAFDNETDLLGGDIGGYKQAQLIPIRYEYGQSGYDIRERAVINFDYDLPFGVGREFVNRPGLLDRIVGGWKTDMEWWGQTGQPFTVGISRNGTDQYGNGYGNVNGGISNNAIKIGNPFSTSLPVPSQTNPATASGISNCPNSAEAGHALRTRQVWYNNCAFIDPPGDTAAAYTLAPAETGAFSYYTPPVGNDPAYYDGIYGPSGIAGSATIGQNGKAASGSNPPVPAPYISTFAGVVPYFGNRKNDISGPGNWRLNASLFKDFRTIREQYLEFRADAFNVLNHPSWGGVGNTGTNPGSGAQITGPMSQQTNTIDARTFQLSGKYVF
jgi:hypothetical protein